MKRRPTYLLLLLLLFAKSYSSALPVVQSSLSARGFEKIRQHSFHDAGYKEFTVLQVPAIDDDNEEDDDYSPVVKQVNAIDLASFNSLLAPGFLIHRFKNAGVPVNSYSSWPPTFLRLRVIRI